MGFPQPGRRRVFFSKHIFQPCTSLRHQTLAARLPAPTSSRPGHRERNQGTLNVVWRSSLAIPQASRFNELFKPLGKTCIGNIFQHISLLSKRAKQTHLFPVEWRRKELTVWSSTLSKVIESTTSTSRHLGKYKGPPHSPQNFNILTTANEQHLGIVGCPEKSLVKTEMKYKQQLRVTSDKTDDY